MNRVMRMRKQNEPLRRGLKVLALLASCAMTLVGCTPVPEFSAKHATGQLYFAYCESFSGDDIVALFRSRGTSEYRTVWTATGDYSVAAGDVIHIGEAPQGMADELPLEVGAIGDGDLQISLGKHDGAGVLVTARTTTFHTKDLVEGHWVDSSGARQETACDL
jgi:hypothetical protein